MLRLIVAVAFVIFTVSSSNAAVLSRESVVSAATINNLNNLLLFAYHRVNAVLEYTGTVSTVPMNKPYIHTYVNLTGDSQQALYGVTKA